MLHLAATEGSSLSETIYFADWYANKVSTWFKVDVIEPKRSVDACRHVLISDEALRLEGPDSEGADVVFDSVEERLVRALAFAKTARKANADCPF